MMMIGVKMMMIRVVREVRVEDGLSWHGSRSSFVVGFGGGAVESVKSIMADFPFRNARKEELIELVCWHLLSVYFTYSFFNIHRDGTKSTSLPANSCFLRHPLPISNMFFVCDVDLMSRELRLCRRMRFEDVLTNGTVTNSCVRVR